MSSDTTDSGWLLLDKPKGVSSFGALSPVRHIVGRNVKVGHAGTLDPFASGLLLVAIGCATRLICYCMEMDKEYHFSIRFGIETDTLDPTGRVVRDGGSIPKVQDIVDVLPQFVGHMEQVPPIFSAIRIAGQRAYDIARTTNNHDVIASKMAARVVHCHAIQCFGSRHTTVSEGAQKSDAFEEFNFSAICGKGFYIRSLARDLAHKLGTIGYVTQLRRTTVGKFSVANAVKMVYTDGDGRVNDSRDAFPFALLPAEAVLSGMPRIVVDGTAVLQLSNGQEVAAPECTCTAQKCNMVRVVAVGCDGAIVGICNFDGISLRPKVVLCHK